MFAQNQYEIFKEWRWHYAPDITHNTEYVFSLQLPESVSITISNREHLGFVWLPWHQAVDKVFSPSNAQAINNLVKRVTQNSSR